jgi:signal transduction histidine kinase
MEHAGQNIHSLVFETGRPARIADCRETDGPGAGVARVWGIRSAVGAPIKVEGRLWGVVTVASMNEAPLPVDTEARLAGFTELVATAVANAESRAALTASRARIVAAADTARSRIERDLHDGAQQHLVSLALKVRAAQAFIPPDAGELAAELDAVAAGIGNVLDELRELAQGIHPPTLARGGIGSALTTLARRSAVPVELEVGVVGRLPEAVEVAVYYVVAEALTNAAKHAQASLVHVGVHLDAARVWLAVRDDGIGGAEPDRGSGLLGLRDRVEAIGGTIDIASPKGSGTTYLVTIPV